jgi:2-polyprenyl-3-methyl-5-hydroxy-6-metoxy-1,4-benzoquinol methylase
MTPVNERNGQAAECRVCGGSSGRAFTANAFAWFNCNGCGSIQKVLTQEQYLNLSPSYDPGAYLDSASSEEIERFLRLEDATVVLRQAIGCRFANSTAATKPSFLDVGCGMGAYLLAAERLGFDVMGFEPSVDHAYVATKRLQLRVISDYFSPDKVGGRTFDLIMLSHVLEHIYAPKQFLHGLISVLKPGGILIVITPNCDSIVARATGALWPMLKPVDHVTMLCAKAYSFFELEGVASVEHRYSEFPYEFAATVAAVLKAKMKRDTSEAVPALSRTRASAPPPLRALSLKTRVLKGILTAASAPAWLTAAATGKRACLNTVIVRRAGST